METQSINHIIKLIDRKNISITGVKRIITFDEKDFLIESIMGNILIKGSGLEVIKLDTIDGTLSIKGTIDSISYSNLSNKKESIVTKLFK